MGLSSFMAVTYQPGSPQDPEMLRHSRLRDPGLSCQCPYRLLSFMAQPFEEGPPGRIRERSEEHIVGKRLRKLPFDLKTA